MSSKFAELNIIYHFYGAFKLLISSFLFYLGGVGCLSWADVCHSSTLQLSID
jgi:hypothetical protein